MGVTSDRSDPRISHGIDDNPVEQAGTYLVLSEEDRAKGFRRPVRYRYLHLKCGGVTTMGSALAETYARDPSFYGATYCASCRMHRPVGALGEFDWIDGIVPDDKVGT